MEKCIKTLALALCVASALCTAIKALRLTDALIKTVKAVKIYKSKITV